MKHTSNIKMPFAIRLIEALKKERFIGSGIMLPLLVGAYAIKDNRTEPLDSRYLKNVFSDLISELYESDQCLYFRECEASHNFVLCTEERPLKSYKLHIYHMDKPVIYCKDAEYDSGINDIDDATEYLIDKYISTLGKYCNYTDKESRPLYPHMRPLDIKGYLSQEYKSQRTELDVINDLLNSDYNGGK